MKRRVGFYIVLLVLVGAFAAYLGSLYLQLEKTFSQQSEFIPTRIYSDVTRITPSQIRSQVLSRLKSLGYSPIEKDNSLVFSLHSMDYPLYLIPDNHPGHASEESITLNFDGADGGAALQSIHLGDAEIPDLYLEPELVATLSRGDTKEIRALVRFNDIPALIWKAIIAIEDQHFLDHKGLDPRGIARAFWVNLKTFSLAQGGSTLTQQLVKNLTARRSKNIFRKINELFLALILEIRFDKEQILERYLNEVYFGQVGNLEVHGVSEAAKYFFGKKLEELNLAEIALMAGLIRGPGFYSPYRHKERAFERQRLVLKRMVETKQIAEAEAKAAETMPIRLAPPQSATNKAPYFTDFVKAELIRLLKDKMTEQEITAAGFRVYTTLDVPMNALAQKAVTQGTSNLALESALVSVDHNLGYIRALVGGKNYTLSTFNRILNMKRQVGSTFKPIVYLAALAKEQDPNRIPYGPGHPIEDAPWKLIYDRGKQSWIPKNYEKDYLGWISYRTALAQSVNIAAAKLGFEVGIESILQTAQSLGISSELPSVPSITLGVAELSPVELARAYSTIANHGVQDELTVIRGITLENGTGYARFIYHPKEVFQPGPMDALTDMMQTVFTEGTARSAAKLGFDRPAAGKTGTTSHHRDAWFAGFTPQLTTVVWVGVDQDLGDQDQKNPKPKVFLTGATTALPIWVQFMKEALSGEPPLQFPLSPHLVSVKIDRRTGKAATRDCPDSQTILEKYVLGNEPTATSCEVLWPASAGEARGD